MAYEVNAQSSTTTKAFSSATQNAKINDAHKSAENFNEESTFKMQFAWSTTNTFPSGLKNLPNNQSLNRK